MSFRKLSLFDYAGLSGAAMARGVADGSLSPVQLVDCALHLAKAAEPQINAYVMFLDDYARARAAEREAEARAGRLRGPLHGVPIAVKDNFYLKGFPVRKGSRTTTDENATYDSPMIARTFEAGMVFMGKTTAPEFGWKGTGISPLTGITRNPYNPSRNSGGSSAGSAATVAARAVPIALGSDAGGSVRIPASFCGIVGLKATLGRMPVYPGTVTETLSHVGPLSRTAEDAALVMAATEGPDSRDPLSFGAQGTGEAARLDRLKSGQLRVGIMASPFGIKAEAGVAESFAAAVAKLRGAVAAGYADAAFDIPLPRKVFETLWVTGRGFGFADLVARHRDIMDQGLAHCYDLAVKYTVPDIFSAIDARRQFTSAAFKLFEQFDLILTPTMPLTAFEADQEVPAGGEADAPLPWITWTPYTYPFNISGQPAVSIPCGMAGGMPVGLQVVGPWGCDELVLEFAKRSELAMSDIPLPRLVEPLLIS